jgi:glycosyltransferase involved in cell wall biosynthesis
MHPRALVLRFVRRVLPPRLRTRLRQRFPGIHRRMTATVTRRFEGPGSYGGRIEERYEGWRRRNEPNEEELQRQRQVGVGLASRPLISVVTPVVDPPVDILRDTLESVLAQTYPRFELCLANAGSDRACAALLQEVQRSDSRVRCVTLERDRGISCTSNAALELATGELVALLDHDAVLAPDALFRAAQLVGEAPDVDIVYSDEDRLAEDGSRFLPFLKPHWSPELSHSFMWAGCLMVYRRNLVQRLGGFRSEYDGSQDYDLMLRMAAATDRIAHIPRVLCHRRMSSDPGAVGVQGGSRGSGRAALQDAIDRSGRRAQVFECPWANRVHFELAERPLVSIIVPTDDEANGRMCIGGVLTRTSYPNVELIVVANTAAVAALEQEFATSERPLRFVRHDAPFNFSRKCNAGARIASGEYLLFLNDDVVPLTTDWLETMLEYAQLPDIGGVSPKLLYADDSIQYAGLVPGVPGLVGTAFHTWKRDDRGYHSLALCVRNVSCLTGACMLLRASDFWRVGGWDEKNTPISHSDFDLSFRLIDAGFRLVYQPFAELRHFGNRSRRDAVQDERGSVTRTDLGADVYMLHRWGDRLHEDPFYTRGMRELLYEKPGEYEVIAPPPSELDEDWWRRPRALLVSHDLSLSGAPMMLREVANALRSDGMLVVVASPERGPLADVLVSSGIPVVIDANIRTRPEASLRFLRGFDLLGANTVLNWRLVQIAKEIEKPCVWLVHEGRFGIRLIEQEGRGAKEAFPLADSIVFPSRHTARLYEQLGGGDRHHAIHNGISDVRAEIEERDASTEREGLRIISVGSLEPRKAAHVLLDAFELLPPETREQLRIELVGRTLDPQYVKKLRLRSVGFPIEFAGEMPRQAALARVRDSDLFVSTSLDESGPLVVIEAMALGKPVISTAVGAATEVITPGVDGELVRPGDAAALAARIQGIVDDPEHRRRLGENARRRFEEHLTSERYGREITGVFRACLSEHKLSIAAQIGRSES